ncbi:DMP19 family protein [Kribbella sp. NBC_01505]|uniref:DMP19 family protein n=1 Tax=Kribbella sp. NBC_01505 TaxID=2903580 RepID=UPI003869E035
MTIDAWAFYEEFAESDRSSLSERERQVLAVCDFRQEVNSGGFDSYFRYNGGDTALTAMTALPRLLGARWADLFGEAVALFGAPYPPDPDERAEKIDDDSLDATLDELDKRFYLLEASTNADARLTEALSA